MVLLKSTNHEEIITEWKNEVIPKAITKHSPIDYLEYLSEDQLFARLFIEPCGIISFKASSPDKLKKGIINLFQSQPKHMKYHTAGNALYFYQTNILKIEAIDVDKVTSDIWGLMDRFRIVEEFRLKAIETSTMLVKIKANADIYYEGFIAKVIDVLYFENYSIWMLDFTIEEVSVRLLQTYSPKLSLFGHIILPIDTPPSAFFKLIDSNCRESIETAKNELLRYERVIEDLCYDEFVKLEGLQ